MSATPTAFCGGVENSPSWVEDAIPQVFSRSTMQCMEKKLITRSVRCEIGEALSHRVYAATEYPSAAEYTAVCVALINKYPVLADTYGNGHVSVMFIIGLISMHVHIDNAILFIGLVEASLKAENEKFEKTS